MSMNWNSLLATSRPGAVRETPEPSRSAFRKDHDRIVFSSAFRRMGRKSQVHPLAENDHLHTRLTHSLEVATVGRSLGILVGQRLQEQKDALPDGVIPEDLGEIVQAACLAHDIGNPPFGHAGEEAVRNWFADHPEVLEDIPGERRRDFLLYEGNAMGFRVVARTEMYQDAGGMRLTHATLGALMKYPWLSDAPIATEKRKFSAFTSEADLLEEVAAALGLARAPDGNWARHPLAFLVEAADDICYRILDMEDAFEVRLLSFERIRDVLAPLCRDSKGYAANVEDDGLPARKRIAFLRGVSIGALIPRAVDAFMNNHAAIMDGTLSDGLMKHCDETARSVMRQAKDIFYGDIWASRRKTELEIGAHAVLGALLDTFLAAARDLGRPGKPRYKSELVQQLLGPCAPRPDDDAHTAYMRVLDYVGGMTDNHATHVAHQIGGMARGGRVS